MLQFLFQMIQGIPADHLLERLNLTAFDELIAIDLTERTFIFRYHTNGKLFQPGISGSMVQLTEYAASHLVHPEDRAAYRQFMDMDTLGRRLEEAEHPGILEGEFRYTCLDGSWRRMEHLLISGEAYGLPRGRVLLYLYDSLEIREREEGQHADAEESTERLRKLLPELLPEASFLALSNGLIRAADNQWCMVAVDIKHFKLFKELNGNGKGDLLLIRFGEILHRYALEQGGLACYRGQDDFGLLIPFEKTRIDQLFADLRNTIDALTSISGFFPILGICMAGDGSEEAMEIFNRAALTAEEIKDDLRFHIRVYQQELHERYVEEFKLLADFNEAMEKNLIHFFLQPQVDILSGRIIGAEALARWQLEDGSFVSPARLVVVLEKYGVVTDLDTRIWEMVCKWIRSLLDRKIRPLPISVNVSRMSIFSVDVPAVLTGLIEKYGLTAEMLEVEITESAYVDDSERVMETISELRRKGFRVLMDDFGSGYSSLNMLRNINVDVIKLDAQFLRFTVGDEQKGIHILESIIGMTKSLATPMIVEGVENRELVLFLRDLGCKYMQGFYYYRPMPPEQFEKLIQDPARVDHRGIVMQRNQQLHSRELLDENLYSDAMLNNILGPVAFFCRQGENIDIVRFNQQFADMVAIEPEQMEERRNHIQQFFFPADVPLFHEMLGHARRDRINGASGLFRIFKPNGSLLWMQLHVYLLREDGNGQTFYGSARDMTELQYINRDLPGGYYRCTLENEFELLYISRTLVKMLGYTKQELMNRYANRLERMIHPEDKETVRRECLAIRRGELENLSPYRILHGDGRYRYVLDQCRVTDQYGEPCWQAVLVDITEVMTLRNRMHLLEKYSGDCILFVRDIRNNESIEVGCYGLEEFLNLGQDEFLRQVHARTLRILNREGRSLHDLLCEPGADLPGLNGVYTLRLEDGSEAKCHVRVNRMSEEAEEMDFIISIIPVSGF